MNKPKLQRVCAITVMLAGLVFGLFTTSAVPGSDKTQASAEAPPTAERADLPSGVMIVRVVIGGDANPVGRNRGKLEIVFADSTGQPLYFSASGTLCIESCLEQWEPVMAPAGAYASGDWTVIPSVTEQPQWAFRGKPLYRFIKEAPAFHEDLRRTNGFAGGFFGSQHQAAGEGLAGMTVAQADPTTWMKMPSGISATEYRMAPGQVLALDVGGATPTGKPLYTFIGTPEEEPRLQAKFRPQFAAELDLPVGEFTIRDRSDGSRQWLFRGAPLYTCDCDVDVGDLNGRDAAPDIEPALVLRYFTPKEVALNSDSLSGGHLVEAKTGRTLYYRDRVKDNWEPDNMRNPLGPQDPVVGATLGLKHCDARCEREWQPLLAPGSAQSQGYWSVYVRPDGRRQWAYKKFALYTHAGEPPGSLNGNETYLIRYDEGRGKRVPEEFGMGLVWRAALP